MYSINSPLSRCLLVESRYSLRAQTKRLVDSTNLFSTLVEARSLSDALARLQSQDYDTCVLGASVSGEAASKFVSAARKATRMRDCAFIVLAESEDLVVPDVDAVLSWPCTRKTFYQSLLATIAKRVREAEQTATEQEPSSSTEYLIEHQSRRLARIQRQVRVGRLGLNFLGIPDSNTEQELRKIVDGLLMKRVTRAESHSLRRDMLEALRTWVTLLVMDTPSAANAHLEKALRRLLVDSKSRDAGSALAA
ncbi:MAG: hypothetical protein U0136_17980 [Bdellovibrionota bacterium]